VSSFYVGGSVGGFVPGLAWSVAGWPGVIALAATVLAIIAAIVAVWPGREGGGRKAENRGQKVEIRNDLGGHR
jgi:MFS transporter, YNFM family, putative membrane transport protein